MVTKILYVDDCHDNLFLFAVSIGKEQDIEVLTAEGMDDAVKTFKEHKDIDIVFMDFQMPKYNGDEVLYELRKLGYEGKCYMLTSAWIGDGGESLNLKSKFDDIINKPFIKDEILKLIRSK